jgi:pimeloyl-ACP methyl ester carboxylesterase
VLHHGIESKKSTNGRAKILRSALGSLCRIAPGSAAVLGERLFITPPPPRRPTREADWAKQARKTVMATDAGDLTAWTWGDGEPTVLLVHGWAGRGLQLGAFAAALVEGGCRVVAYDAPGHGSSPGRTSSLIEMARGAGAMTRALGGVDAVIAHSLGATAVVLAAGRGELSAGRLVVLAPSASLWEIVARFGLMTGFSPEVLGRMRRRLAKRFHFDWDASEPLVIAPRMEMPLFVVHDEKDRFVPHAEGASLADGWPGGELMTTHGLGHHRLLREPTVVARVSEFVLSTRADSNAGHNQRLTAWQGETMTAITMHLTALWNRLCTRFGFCFDIDGINLDETELKQQLSHGRDR